MAVGFPGDDRLDQEALESQYVVDGDLFDAVFVTDRTTGDRGLFVVGHADDGTPFYYGFVRA